MAPEVGRGRDLNAFAEFVSSTRWRFAKTYVESYPHEYTLQSWGDGNAFGRAVLCIERWGIVEPFWGSHRKYLYVDDRKYWHMGDPASDNPDEHPTLINRTWLEVERYRDNARELGYDEVALDRLGARWVMLLQQARGRR